MKNVFTKIQEQFGFEEPPHALFFSFDKALRFELGGEENEMDRPMRRFVQAHQRATTVSQTFFQHSDEVFVLFSSYGGEKPEKKRLKSLKPSGLKKKEIKYLCGIPQRDDDEESSNDLFRHWDVAKIEDRQVISEILWLGIASEMPIEPSFRGWLSAYFVDISNGLILHAYDDRGMDVVATKYAPLKELFTKHRTWLLESDFPEMAEMFVENT